MEQQRQYIELSLQEASNGRIIAYASVFDVVSASGIVIRRGAFTQSLDYLLRNGYLLWSHNRDGFPLGIIEEAYEDDYGLRIVAQFHSTDEAQTLRRIIEERLAFNREVALSIAFFVDDYESDEQGRMVVKQAQIIECSIVLYPDNPEARVIAVQERQPLRKQIEDSLTSIRVAIYEASLIANRVRSLKMLRASEERDISAMTKTTIEELSQQVAQLITALSSIAQELDASLREKDENVLNDINDYVKLFELDLL